MTQYIRAERVQQVQAFREDGMLLSEIVEATGLSRSYVCELFRDPEGLLGAARKLGYRGFCMDCGKRTSGSNGRAAAPKRCLDCARLVQRHWTRERILDAIHRYAEDNGGKPPNTTIWSHVNYEKDYPSARMAYGDSCVFDSWADALEAAGFPRPRQGGQKWMKPDIIERIQATATEGVAAATTGKDPIEKRLYAAAKYHFGSWAEACRAAGLRPYKQAHTLWTRESVMTAIWSRSENGVAPHSNSDVGLRAAANRLFGSWWDAVEASGVQHRPGERRHRRDAS